MNAPQSNLQRQRDSENAGSFNANFSCGPALASLFETGEPIEQTSDKQYSSDLHLSPNNPDDVEPLAPCYFLKLPAELRQEVFSYLMPEEPIHSLIVYDANWSTTCGTIVTGGSLRTRLPVELHSILLGFGREMYQEIKDMFYSITTFTIDITRDGVMLCGRRILLPFVRDRYNFQNHDQQGIDRFLRHFDWSAVKNYTVNIVLGRQECAEDPRMGMNPYDDEVELYDMRDYVAIVVSGVLSKARDLRNLLVSVETKDPSIVPRYILEDARMLIVPFERLRRVKKPRFLGVFRDINCYPTHIHRHRRQSLHTAPLCARINLRPVPLLTPDMPDFASFVQDWESTLATKAAATILPASPMTQLFVEFKALHGTLVQLMPNAVRLGRQCFLHRARVAREKEDIEGFRAVERELMACWRHQLQLRELEKQEVERALKRVVDADVYPEREGAARR
ncbi:hypothetical protein SVAN01_05576 [Stagonosporopsis vannaccii]|nr:hypothetical protein SVAN01_05576 [Stagonosporopsis vannaccii]